MSLDSPISKVYLRMCEAVDSPRSLACWLLYSHKEFEQFFSLEVDPNHYGSDRRDILVFQRDYAVTSYLSKNNFVDFKVDKKRQALHSFYQGEEDCRLTNTLFKLRADGYFSFSPRVERFLLSARQKISDWTQRFDVSRTIIDASHGPGSTFNLIRGNATPDIKVFDLSSYPKAQSWLKFDLCHAPLWRKALFESGHDQVPRLTMGNRVTTVPKKATTDRTIGIEATQMVFYQKAIGNQLRSLLKRVGCDLNDSSLNQRLALAGSLTGEIATEDLKNASNSIARELIFELFPVDLAIHLDTFRAPSYFLDGSWRRYEMFSSMGNGYTFELESMIFLAIARSVVPRKYWHQVNVFGDDIIVPSAFIEDLRDVLSAIGFKSNPSKSFSDGYFRESCGKHFFFGVDVTPVYQKTDIVDDPIEAVNACNRLFVLMQLSGISSPYFYLSRYIRRRWSEVPVYDPSVVGFSSGFLWVDSDSSVPMSPLKVKSSIRYYRALSYDTIEVRPNYLGRLINNTRHGSPTSFTRGQAIRGRGKLLLKWISF